MSTKDRASVWSITVWGAEIELVERKEAFPDWVKAVAGGREACPKSGRVHFQGMLQCRRQVRMSQIKSWLPTAHLEVSRDRFKLQKYVMKSETAIGEKTVQSNPNDYMTLDDFMMHIAYYSEGFDLYKAHETRDGKLTKVFEDEYWYAVNRLTAAARPSASQGDESPCTGRKAPSIKNIIGVAALPAPRTLWIKMRDNFKQRLAEETDSITRSPLDLPIDE